MYPIASVDQTKKIFHEVAELAKSLYVELENFELQFLDYSENYTCLASNEAGQRYVLRINRPDYHSKEQIEAEIAYILSIHQHSSIHTALPIPSIQGHYVNTHHHLNKTYYSCLFTFIEGTQPDENSSSIFSQFENLGQITATLHLHSMEHAAKFSTFNRLSWNDETILGDQPIWGKWQDGHGMTQQRIQQFELAANMIRLNLQAYGQSADRYGLVHCDLRLTNLLIHANAIHVIDFDDCGFSWYLYDLASAVSFIEHLPQTPNLIAAWITGYEKVRTLSSIDKSMIPTFILMRRLQLIAWIGSHNNETSQLYGANYTYETDALIEDYLKQHQSYPVGGARNVN